MSKPEIRKAYKFGGEQISFSVDEIATIRNFGDPVIRIVGFKALDPDHLPIWANLKGATFLYPSEEDYIGSTRVFSALQQKMLSNGKIAIAWFVARKNAVPQVVALVAAMDQVDEKSGHILPSGIWLVPLPFTDDIRSNPETPVVTPPDPLIDKMRAVVQQLQLPKGRYIPAKYPNPGMFPVIGTKVINSCSALQWHYRVLQALALEDEAPTQSEDKTIPKYKQISKVCGGPKDHLPGSNLRIACRCIRGRMGGRTDEATSTLGREEPKVRSSTEATDSNVVDRSRRFSQQEA